MSDTIFFLKEIVSNPLVLSNGRRIKFDDIGDDMGALETNDQGLIKELRQAQASGIGGVREVSAKQLEDAKKNAAAQDSRKQSLLFKIPLLQPNAGAPPAAVINPKPTVPSGQPISTPQSLPPSPVRRRRSKVIAEVPVETVSTP